MDGLCQIPFISYRYLGKDKDSKQGTNTPIITRGRCSWWHSAASAVLLAREPRWETRFRQRQEGPKTNSDSQVSQFSDDKILDWSQLKAFADDKKNATEMLIFFFLFRGENIVGNGENAGYQHFFSFSQNIFNQLPDDKFLDRSKLKWTADDILKCI